MQGLFTKYHLETHINQEIIRLKKRKPRGAVLLHWLLNQKWQLLWSLCSICHPVYIIVTLYYYLNIKLFELIYILCLQTNLFSLIHCTSETFFSGFVSIISAPSACNLKVYQSWHSHYKVISFTCSHYRKIEAGIVYDGSISKYEKYGKSRKMFLGLMATECSSSTKL